MFFMVAFLVFMGIMWYTNHLCDEKATVADWIASVFIGLLISTGLGAIIQVGYASESDPFYYVDTDTKIYSLRSNQNVSGNFVLGSGLLDSSMVYSYLIRVGDDEYTQNSVPVEGTILKETDDHEPTVRHRKAVYKNWMVAMPWNYFTGGEFKGMSQKNESSHTVIIIPTDTIVGGYDVGH